MPWFGAKPDNLEVMKGQITEHESSPGIRRGFCVKCGSSLTFGGEGWNDIGITIASLDDPNGGTAISQLCEDMTGNENRLTHPAQFFE